jgi:hypothetical protein
MYFKLWLSIGVKMKHLIGDIWILHSRDQTIAIPTNGVTVNGELIMGRGLALEAKERYPSLPLRLGSMVREHGNFPFYVKEFNLVSFPTKHNPQQKSDIHLIKQSAYNLRILADKIGLERVYLPHVGCGNGGLFWGEVYPVINEILNDGRFIICDIAPF